MPTNSRKLKITPRPFKRTWSDAIFPEIRIAGKWLQDLGFTCGKFVRITEEENKIVIMLVEEVQQEAPPIKSRSKPYKIIPLDAYDKPINQLFVVHPAPQEGTDTSGLNTPA
jgi:toxic protein SymE